MINYKVFCVHPWIIFFHHATELFTPFCNVSCCIVCVCVYNSISLRSLWSFNLLQRENLAKNVIKWGSPDRHNSLKSSVIQLKTNKPLLNFISLFTKKIHNICCWTQVSNLTVKSMLSIWILEASSSRVSFVYWTVTWFQTTLYCHMLNFKSTSVF